MNEIELVIPIEALPKARCTRCNAVLRSDNTGTKCAPCARVLGDAVTKRMGENNQRKLQNERRRAAKVSQ